MSSQKTVNGCIKETDSSRSLAYIGPKKDRWVCPNDRELTLRSKLSAGWSMKSINYRTDGHLMPMNLTNNAQSISDVEQQHILNVLQRSQEVEQMERTRINKLIERIKNMKKNARGNDEKCCALCNDPFYLFSNHYRFCNDCYKAICAKCGVEYTALDTQKIYLCKICSETREMWKKSGAWFFNSLPSYCYNLAIALQQKSGETEPIDFGLNKSQKIDQNQITQNSKRPVAKKILLHPCHVSGELTSHSDIITTPVVHLDSYEDTFRFFGAGPFHGIQPTGKPNLIVQRQDSDSSAQTDSKSDQPIESPYSVFSQEIEDAQINVTNTKSSFSKFRRFHSNLTKGCSEFTFLRKKGEDCLSFFRNFRSS